MLSILSQNFQKNIRERYGGGGIFSGVAAFSTTDATGQLACPFKQIDSCILTALGAPATGTATDLIDLQLASLSAIAATTTFLWRVPKTGTITSINFTVDTTVSTSDTNYWNIGIVDITNSNAVIVDGTVAANTNKATGGAAFTADTVNVLTLASAAVTAGDVLEITITKNSSAANLVELQMDLQMTYASTQAADEVIYLDEAATPNSTSGVFNVPATAVTGGFANSLTISRAIGGLTSGLTSGKKFLFRIEGNF